MPKPKLTKEAATVSAEDLKRFGEVLCGTGKVFEAIADWLKENEVTGIFSPGMPTARRGCQFLANFASTVLNAYHETRLGNPADGIEPGVIARGAEARALAKKMSTPDAETIASNRANDAVREAIEMAGNKAEKKRVKKT